MMHPAPDRGTLIPSSTRHGIHDPSLADDRGPVTRSLHLVENVGGHQNRCLSLFLLQNKLHKPILHQRIQTARRLIQNKYL